MCFLNPNVLIEPFAHTKFTYCGFIGCESSGRVRIALKSHVDMWPAAVWMLGPKNTRTPCRCRYKCEDWPKDTRNIHTRYPADVKLLCAFSPSATWENWRFCSKSKSEWIFHVSNWTFILHKHTNAWEISWADETSSCCHRISDVAIVQSAHGICFAHADDIAWHIGRQRQVCFFSRFRPVSSGFFSKLPTKLPEDSAIYCTSMVER